jgi:hypothetical protein
MRESLFTCILLMLLAPLAPAQQCTTKVAINAFDSRTKDSLYGLTAADFQAAVGRSQLRISGVQPVFRNRVLVLLDSSSHADQENLRAMAELVTEAPPGMPVAFGVVGRSAALTRGFITDPDALSSAVDEVMAQASILGPGNALPAALHHALEVFGPHQPGDTILLVSSGRNRQSKRTMDKLRKEFRRHGARLQLLVGLLPTQSGRSNDPSLLFAGWAPAENVSDNLVRLANSTGGALMGFMNSDWAGVASSGYMLSIVTPAEMSKPRAWKLRVRDIGNDVPPADLFYPEQLAPCAAPAIAALLSTQTKPRP